EDLICQYLKLIKCVEKNLPKNSIQPFSDPLKKDLASAAAARGTSSPADRRPVTHQCVHFVMNIALPNTPPNTITRLESLQYHHGSNSLNYIPVTQSSYIVKSSSHFEMYGENSHSMEHLYPL
ncbi:hypothetical protein HW555_003266, partial [Spodoptera exigua]